MVFTIHNNLLRKFQWILPFKEKTIVCKSKGFVCLLFSHNSDGHCFSPSESIMFSVNSDKVVEYLNSKEKAIAKWNVNQISMPIIS